ncbi:MAG: acyl-CoA thioesterase [Candidatus Binatia bacterium]
MRMKIGEEARIFEIVFPTHTNNYNTLFGGHALSLMDRLAYIVSSRYARKQMVTVASDKVEFRHPVNEGDLVELVGKVVRAGRTSVTVDIDMYSENLLSGARELCTTAEFVMVAVDGDGNPASVPQD